MNNAYFLKRATTKGFQIRSYDDPTGVVCPRLSCNMIVVYNGNYFCECGWALAYGRYTQAQQEYVDSLLVGLREYRDRRRKKKLSKGKFRRNLTERNARIREMRKHKSVSEISKELGVSRQRIYQILGS